ncbi:MAG: hypothetical protein PHO02_07265 [Candidatus Nanoarchaeia archaeon]|nr:hypothetical protein [Candidatus Nanoarchaeia archaeon]
MANRLYSGFTMDGDKIDRIFFTPKGFERIVMQNDTKALESVVDDIHAGMEWRKKHKVLTYVYDAFCTVGQLMVPR